MRSERSHIASLSLFPQVHLLPADFHVGTSCYTGLQPPGLCHPCRPHPRSSDTSLVLTFPVSVSCRDPRPSNPACLFEPCLGGKHLVSIILHPGIQTQPFTCLLLPSCRTPPKLLDLLDQVWQHLHPDPTSRTDIANQS